MNRYYLVIIGMMMGLVPLWGCSGGPAANESQGANRPTVTSQTKEESEADKTEVNQPDETAPVDEVQPTEAAPTSPPKAEATSTATSPPTTEPSPTATDEPVEQPTAEIDEAEEVDESAQEADPGSTNTDLAHVISVGARGEPGSYNFSVEISSPDTGCDQYADWWEVLTEDGELLYRRILAHSHVNEQPFVRSGGPVEIAANDIVLVRAHMNPGGYGGAVFKGAPETGFEAVDISPDFAAGAANQNPLPTGCAF